jgi:hypothetical protein
MSPVKIRHFQNITTLDGLCGAITGEFYSTEERIALVQAQSWPKRLCQACREAQELGTRKRRERRERRARP